MQIFLSFAYDEDKEQVNGFRSMLENPTANIHFVDGSCKKDYSNKPDAQIKAYIRSLIDKASVTVCLISEDTKDSKWVQWELEASQSMKKGIVGIVLKGKNDKIKNLKDCPTIFNNDRYKVYKWVQPEKLQKLIEEAEKIDSP